MRRLILGCGYLGLRVAHRWRTQGDEVHTLTRSSDRANTWRESGFIAHLGDVLDPVSLHRLPVVDTVLWAIGWDKESGASQRDVYVNGLQNALAQLHGKWNELLYVSSTSVYGQSNGEWVDELSDCLPGTPNGEVCRDAELLVLELNSPSGSKPSATVLRFSGIYGPGRLLARASAIQSGAILQGNPDAWLNLIHVDDGAAAVVSCQMAKERQALYLISDDEPLTRRTYYSYLASLLDAPQPDFESNVSGNADFNRWNKRCRNTLARRGLGWTLRYPTYREGLPHALETR